VLVGGRQRFEHRTSRHFWRPPDRMVTATVTMAREAKPRRGPMI
jgi:hypothetical protein